MPRRHVFWAIALVATVLAFAHAWALRWTCDDAYISFRYARNFLEGHGLVFNLDPNEAPVEGYTNFAWTMWLVVGMAVGFVGDRIETWAALWGALFHAGTTWLLAATAWRASGGRARVPIAACAFAVVHHAASLAPAGLETAMFTLLATALLRVALEEQCRSRSLLMGFVGVLLAMTRPDGALFVAVVGMFLLHDARRRRSLGRVLSFALPFVAVFLPYLLWRRFFYGDWVPNTFYAKSASDPYPAQGFRYVQEFAKCYWALAPALALPLYYSIRKPDPLASISPWLGRRPHLAILSFVGSYLAFVVWVGGDFMFGRFLVPILPALLLGLDFGANRWRSTLWQFPLAAAVVVGLLSRVEPPWLDDYTNPYGFSDNRAISMKEFDGRPVADVMRDVGNYLGGKFGDLGMHVAIVGSQANLAYRGRFPVVIECATGLTDVRIAHQPLLRRGQPGHEKGYRRLVRYLTHERRVQITFDLDFLAGDVTDAYRDVLLAVIPARLMIYDRELMAALRDRDPNVRFVDFEKVLDEYLARLPETPDERTVARVRRDLSAFRRYYFDHNDDGERLRRFEEYLR